MEQAARQACQLGRTLACFRVQQTPFANLGRASLYKSFRKTCSNPHFLSLNGWPEKGGCWTKRRPALETGVGVRLCSSNVDERKENIFTWPNLLSVSRLAMAPVLGYLVCQESFQAATCVLAVAGATDLVDGFIARNVPGQKSVLGSVLDPLADKWLVGIVVISLASVKLIPVPLAVVLLGRDVLLVLSSFVLRYNSLAPPRTLRRYFDVTLATVQFQPNFLGKLNTGLQLSMIACSLVAPVFGFVNHHLLQYLWLLTGSTTILSGISYMLSNDVVKMVGKATNKKQ